MSKRFAAIAFIIMTVVLTAACTEQDTDAEAVVNIAQNAEALTPAAEAGKAGAETATDEQVSVMDLPVDFSSPENIEKSIEAVRQQAGKAEAQKLTRALGYILAYDASLEEDKEKLYKKMDGRTPNEIIGAMKR